MIRKFPKGIGLKLKNYGSNCHYCRDELWRNNFTLDHVVPVAQGGTNHRENKVACCRRCNTLKSSLTLKQFRPIFFYETGYRYFAFEPEWEGQKCFEAHERKLMFPIGD